ncbi:MAG: cupredoxin domain-containing protein [Candidatus Micrarchaeota archaeon]|mgnify:CR=1 FL=1
MKLFIVLGLVFALLLFGCAGSTPTTQTGTQSTAVAPSTATDTAKEFKVTIGHDSGYNPKAFTVNKGDVVRFLAVTEPGTSWHGHGITIDEYGVNQVVKSEDKSNPVKIQFTADKTGTFKIYCKTCDEPTNSWKATTGGAHPDIQATLIVK